MPRFGIAEPITYRVTAGFASFKAPRKQRDAKALFPVRP